MSNDNNYMREYMKKRSKERMKEAHQLLGGKCCKCGSINNLQIDHIDPLTKSFTLSSGTTFSKERWDAELAKCQLLCFECHKSKTLKERNFQEVKDKNIHGTISSYRYCHCDVCKKARAEYIKKYRLKQK
jgi:5-methylcytosine-specific restriction endonuclease McrA